MIGSSYFDAQTTGVSTSGQDPPALPPAVLDAIRSLRYGTVEIVVHNGKVVQVERREKVRFDQDGSPQK